MSASVEKLDFSSRTKLYGRADELALLRDAYQRVSSESDGSSQVVLIRGYSGTGKSALVETFRDEIIADNNDGSASSRDDVCPYFVSGKFNQLNGGGEPYDPIPAVFGDLCDIILASSEKDEMRTIILEALGGSEERKIITQIIPKVRQIIGDDDGPGQDSDNVLVPDTSGDPGNTGVKAFHKLQFVFRVFVRSVCTPVHPVILFLNDLEWADVTSLELIQTLVTDPRSKHLLLIGSYRDNKVDEHHPLSTHLLDACKTQKAVISKIHLGNLDVAMINEFISDMTKLDTTTTQPLTDIVYRKTHGNMFFVLQFLDLLQEEDLLFFCWSSYRWTWDLDRIQSETNSSDNVAELVADKIQRLPRDVQSVLKIAACLFSMIDVDVLDSILREVDLEDCWPDSHHDEGCCRPHVECKADLLRILNVAASEGLVDKVHPSKYKFAHDRIQACAYSLIPEGDARELMHLKIGMHMLNLRGSSGEGGKERMLFVAANQLNRGSAQIVDETKRIELAQLNLRVGKMAMSKSAFVPAAEYLQSGIDLLGGERKWKQRYGLCVELYTATAEMLYCSGSFEKCRKVIHEVLANARSLDDRIPAQLTLVDLLGAEGMLYEAMAIGFEILRELGESFPKRVTRVHVFTDQFRTRRMLGRRTDEELLELPAIDDGGKLTAMKLLNSLARYAYFLSEAEYLALIAFRQMQLSLRIGMSCHSAMAYALYGVVLSILGEFKEAHRFGRLALNVLDRLHDQDTEAGVLVLVNTFLKPWQDPLQESLNPLLRGHQVGMESGDIDFAFFCASSYCSIYYCSGLSLKPIEADMRAFCRQMVEYKQKTACYLVMPYWQAVLNLMGRSDDPLQLTGEAMDQDAFAREVAESRNINGHAYFARMQLAYYFGDLDLASNMSQKLQKCIQTLKADFVYCVFTAFDGLISVGLARKTGKQKYRVHARKCMKRMKKWAKGGNVNCTHKLLLLQAEYDSLVGGDEDVTIEAYNVAISTATKSGFLQDAALANERAGIFCREVGDIARASMYFSHACELYSEWGAQAKADQLQEQLSTRFIASSRGRRSSGLRARRRFSQRLSQAHKMIRLSLSSSKLFGSHTSSQT